MRFSLAALVLVVCLAAVACAALRFATDLWASVIWTITILVLLFGLLVVVVGSREQRARWLGVTIFGCGYLLLVFGPWFDERVAPQLLTTKLWNWGHEQMLELAGSNRDPVLSIQLVTPNPPAVAKGMTYLRTAQGNGIAFADQDQDGWLDVLVDAPPTNSNNLSHRAFAVGWVPAPPGVPAREHFTRIGQCLTALILAWLGGMAAQRLTRHPERSHGCVAQVTDPSADVDSSSMTVSAAHTSS
jgi:hypothetical protein